MKDWIKKILDPPGMERKNWRSIFSFIGRVFGIVKDDAVKAHNAFFPYLCDSEKLREHGKVLMIPELPYDTEEGYRDRVATASFYLMRAGERAYIHEQLRAHLKNTYLLTENFLRVLIKISDLNDEKKAWVFSFLDEILDPNISMAIAEWFHYVEKITFTDYFKINLKSSFMDCYSHELYHDGEIYYDGRHSYSEVLPLEKLSITLNTGKFTEKYRAKNYYNGTTFHDGENYYDGYINASASEIMKIRVIKHHYHDEQYYYDGEIYYDSEIPIPLE